MYEALKGGEEDTRNDSICQSLGWIG